MSEKYAVGVDLGGTNVRYGIVSKGGKTTFERSRPVEGNRTPAKIIDILTDIAREAKTRANISGIGIGAPGIVDFDAGSVIRSPHYPSWRDFELRALLAKRTGLPVVLDNDANMIAYGEAGYGAGKGLKNFVMITLGTGIGGGIVIDGKVFHGDHGFAGELGHQVIFFDGAHCDCGGRGCWETMVSIEGIRQISGLDPKALFDMAANGDRRAFAAWQKFGEYFGAGVASLANVLGIFNFVIGGGIGNALKFFLGPAKKEITRRTFGETAKRLNLIPAGLGDMAGIMGSARMALYGKK